MGRCDTREHGAPVRRIDVRPLRCILASDGTVDNRQAWVAAGMTTDSRGKIVGALGSPFLSSVRHHDADEDDCSVRGRKPVKAEVFYLLSGNSQARSFVRCWPGI